MSPEVIRGSFRDPCGFIFRQEGQFFRQINPVGQKDYEQLMSSGLYQALIDAGLLINHTEVPGKPGDAKGKIIRPEQISFVSYPWEWCFSQFQDAAMATLQIQKLALKYGMSLKDSSAFNIQFIDARPVLIDTLSFEKLQHGEPWVAYRQFCQHFLAPLALMCYADVRLLQLFRVHLDGIPLDLASKLLPRRTWLKFSLLTHIHLHARSQKYYSDKALPAPASSSSLSQNAQFGILDSLESGIASLKIFFKATEWGDYYSDTNYSDVAIKHKEELVVDYLSRDKTFDNSLVWDLGANTGHFSRLAVSRGLQTVAFDVDPLAVEKNYRLCRQNKETGLLPLLLDLTNPSPACGWANCERLSLGERGLAGTIMALALIHHLAISNNLPLARIAEFFADHCRRLIIEFVPKADSQVQRLLASRKDIFTEYSQPDFEREFSALFKIEAATPIKETGRTLYLMRRLQA